MSMPGVLDVHRRRCNGGAQCGDPCLHAEEPSVRRYQRTVLDGAVIEEGGLLGAGGLLTPGKVIGRNELWTGSPAKLRRVMDEDERKNLIVTRRCIVRWRNSSARG